MYLRVRIYLRAREGASGAKPAFVASMCLWAEPGPASGTVASAIRGLPAASLFGPVPCFDTADYSWDSCIPLLGITLLGVTGA
jgi:hypothetical protein